MNKKIVAILAVLLVLAAVIWIVFWEVQAKEIAPKVTQAELIESNKSWVATKTPLPLTENIFVNLPARDSKISVTNSGDLVFETSNPNYLKQLADENDQFTNIKEYRLLIFADKVSEYFNNSKYRYPTGHAHAGMSDYQIESGIREIDSGKESLPLKQSGQTVIVKNSLATDYSNDMAKDAAKAFEFDILDQGVTVDDQFETAYQHVTAYPKEFYYDFNVTKKAFFLLNNMKEATITEPVGIEYVMK
ncbi:hypothetical protein [Listeria ilorinensis]|uniref:hypothetical protein n=1 Tax=Listeria ilorinensis TaxID=2867439 RepID=UPI001EF5F8BC|nr:hypothetical protein [Listeria ilorinensis]